MARSSSTETVVRFPYRPKHDRSLPVPENKKNARPPPLPSEILEQIFKYIHCQSDVQQAQGSLHAISLQSRSWYQSSITFLYAHPVISGKNYDLFVRAICPSINAHIRHNGLADLVRTLDMSKLVYHGSKSLTARLLGRVKNGLEIFVAPQASFAYAWSSSFCTRFVLL